jgi:hypothetical protein
LIAFPRAAVAGGETMDVPPPPIDQQPHTRGMFIRDVLVLQIKLLLLSLHNFVLVPLTLGAVALDLLFKSGRHGSRFYRTLDWGRQAEEAIDLYSALDDLRPETGEAAKASSEYTSKPAALPPAEHLH